MDSADTIFALSSGAPPAAIAIIRISGACAFDAVRLLAGRVPPNRHPSLARLYDPKDGVLIDQGLLLLFPAINSVTGEDLAELHLHGGRAVVRAMERVLSEIAGLRRAEAGEFTRRSFINGRIDLNEADGLADLLLAETEWQRRAAAQMMSGAFGRAIEKWRIELLRISALVEAELDFSDEDDVDNQNKQVITGSCYDICVQISDLLAQPPAERLRDGLRVVLGGPPNCGKSSLLNALVTRDAAIVSDIAGTTRDVIEIPIAFDGIAFVFIDTAGVRTESKDAIEKIGIERAKSAFVTSDILLWLGAEGQAPAHQHLIEIDAKSDDLMRVAKSSAAISLSAQTGEGMNRLIEAIVKIAKNMMPPQDHFAVNSRQRGILSQAVDAIADAADSSDWLIVGENLRLARLALDKLSGRAHTEDMLDVLFSRFCVGK